MKGEVSDLIMRARHRGKSIQEETTLSEWDEEV